MLSIIVPNMLALLVAAFVLHDQAKDLRLLWVLRYQDTLEVVWVLLLSLEEGLLHLLDECFILWLTDHRKPFLCVVSQHNLILALGLFIPIEMTSSL